MSQFLKPRADAESMIFIYALCVLSWLLVLLWPVSSEQPHTLFGELLCTDPQSLWDAIEVLIVLLEATSHTMY